MNTRLALDHLAWRQCTMAMQTVQLGEQLDDLFAGVCVVDPHVHKVLHGQCKEPLAVDSKLCEQRRDSAQMHRAQEQPQVRRRAGRDDVYNDGGVAVKIE